MSMSTKTLREALRKLEEAAASELRSRQATQSFSGALKVNSNRVFIDSRDGRLALERLRRIGHSSK